MMTVFYWRSIIIILIKIISIIQTNDKKKKIENNLLYELI